MEDNQIKDAEMQVDDTKTVENESDVETGGAGVGDSVGASDTDDIVIPDNWESDIKDFLNSVQDIAGKKAIFNKIKSLDTGYQKKFADLATQRKTFENDRKAFESDRGLVQGYRDLEKAFGDNLSKIYEMFGSVPAYIHSLYQNDLLASQDPAKFIVSFCEKAGIDSVDKLRELLEGDAGQKVRNEMNMQNLENKFNKQLEERIANERERVRLEAQVEAFKNSPGHEHFDRVRNTMAGLAERMPEKSLQELYDMAVYADAELRTQMFAKAESERKASEQAEVEKAKKAVGITNKSSVKSTENKNWRQLLAEEIGADE